MQLPSDKTLQQVFSDMDGVFENFSASLSTMKTHSVNNGCNITRSFDEDTRTITLTYDWPDQSAVDSFYEFANSICDYNALLDSYKAYLEANGGSFTKIDVS